MKNNPLDLLPLVEKVLEDTDVSYAIGGGVAMAAHGYSRETEDLDIFFLHTDGPKVLRALRKAKIPFGAIADPYHFAIIPSVKNINHRIDLLFTSDDLEMAAVEFPENVEAGDEDSLPVFPAALLVAAKVRSDRDKDHSDVRRMHERGMFDPDEVLKILRHYDEPGAKKRLTRVLRGEKP